jgi:hypothetical protein
MSGIHWHIAVDAIEIIFICQSSGNENGVEKIKNVHHVDSMTRSTTCQSLTNSVRWAESRNRPNVKAAHDQIQQLGK